MEEEIGADVGIEVMGMEVRIREIIMIHTATANINLPHCSYNC
jgi:hypothetical protein